MAPALWLTMGVSPRPGAPLRPSLRVLRDGVVTERRLPPLPFPHPPGDHAELTGSRLTPDALLVCTRTGVLWLDRGTLAVRRALSHPLMHDVHDAVALPDGGVAVAATGVDSVLAFQGDTLRAHHWLRPDGTVTTGEGGRPAGFDDAFGAPGDLRQRPFDLHKPHAVHPNHLAVLDGEVFVTSLNDRRCRSLAGRTLVVLPAPPHDGDVFDGLRWFTTVDGHVLAVAPDGEIAERYDVVAAEGADGLPGWCRGVCVHGGVVWVGMTSLRASRSRELLRVALRGRRGRKQPTRIVALRRGDGAWLGSWPVGEPGGGTVYGVHADVD